MRTLKTISATLLLLLIVQPVQAGDIDIAQRLDAYFDEAVEAVHATDDPDEKREILSDSFDDMATALGRIGRLPGLSAENEASIDGLRSDIRQHRKRLAHVPDANLDRFADSVQQDLVLGNRTITLSLTTVLLILIILILLL